MSEEEKHTAWKTFPEQVANRYDHLQFWREALPMYSTYLNEHGFIPDEVVELFARGAYESWKRESMNEKEREIK